MTAFERYWAAVPTKIARKLCADIWKRKRLDDKIEIILADIELRKRMDDRWLNGFIPNPATYLRQERWEDEIVKPRNGTVTHVTPAKRYTPPPELKHDWEGGMIGIQMVKAALRR